MRNVLVAALVAVLVGITGCSSKSATCEDGSCSHAHSGKIHSAAPQKLVHLKQSDSGGSFVVSVGADITVTLNENPSKNGKWFATPSDYYVLKDESKRTTDNTNQDRKFTYHAHVAGSDYLTFVYKEGDKEVDSASFHLTTK
jgi:predicted secreted protein